MKIRSFFQKLRRRVLGLGTEPIHSGRRAVVRGARFRPGKRLVKEYDLTKDGGESLQRELLAKKLFGDHDWFIPVRRAGFRKLAMDRYREVERLDRATASMDEATRVDVARQAIRIAWDLFQDGYAHRDMHAKNCFWVNGRLHLGDFETLTRYPEGDVPAFPESYDVTGEGLPTPYETKNMGYGAARHSTLEKITGISKETALKAVQELLKDELREASLSFQTHQKRHNCKAQKIYTAFTVPHFFVGRDEAQRDAARRLVQFGITEETVAGRSVLDLGSNVGGILFELQNFKPASSLGVEYDAAKVAIARKVALYAGLKNIRFEQMDIDKLDPEQMGPPKDIVLCLAIDKHVKKPERLFWLLGRITAGTLYFEGNSGSDPEEVRTRLLSEGFAKVENLGLSDDDCLPENNIRPILRASK